MADKRVMELAFAIGGKLDANFIGAVGEASKKLKELTKEAQETANRNKLAAEQTKMFNDLGKQAAGASAAWGNFGNAVLEPIKTIAKVGAVAAGASASIYALGLKTAEMGDTALKTAKKVGINIEAFSGLKYAADQSMINADSFATSMEKMNKNISAAVKGNKEAKLAFERAGVSIYDANGKLKDSNQILLEASDMFKRMPEGIYKADLAMALFGKSGADMVPLMEQGSDAIKQLQADAKRMGIIFDEDEGKRASAFTSSVTAAKSAIQGLAIAVGKQLHGPLTDITNSFTEFIIANRELIASKAAEFIEEFKNHLPQIKEFLLAAVEGIKNFVKATDNVSQSLGGWGNAIKLVTGAWGGFNIAKIAVTFSIAAMKTATLVQSFMTFLPVIKAVGIAFALPAIKIMLVVAAIAAVVMAVIALEKKFNVFSNFFKGFVGFFKNEITKIKEAFQGGFLNGILEIFKRLATLGPRYILEMVSNVIKSFTGFDLKAVVMEKFEAVKALFFEFIDYVKSMFNDGFVNGIINILKNFNIVSVINTLIAKIFGIDLIAKGWEWIKGFTTGIINGIKGAAGAVLDAAKGLIPQGLKDVAGGVKNVVSSVLPKFADGGIVNRPQIAMVGEAGPEAIIPLTKPARAAAILKEAQGEISPAQQLSNSISNNNSRTNVSGGSFNFSPNITINAPSGDSQSISNAVNNAISDWAAKFQRMFNEREYNAARVAMA